MVLLKQINSSSHCFEKNNSNSILRVFFSGSPEHSRHTPLGSRPSCKIQLYPLLLVTRAQHRRFVQTRPFLLNFTCYGPLKKRRGCYNGRQWRRTCFFILSSTFVRCNSHQKISTMLCCCCCSLFFFFNTTNTAAQQKRKIF